MDLSKLKVRLKNGQETEIIKHEGDRLNIKIDGKEKTYVYEVVFKKGFFVALDPKIQKEIMDDLAEKDKLRNNLKNLDVDDEPISKPSLGVNKPNTYKGRIKSSIEDNLMSYHFYGTKALDIYDECCEKLGFKSSERGYFGLQKPLYAPNATKEGYGVWFLAHSSWTETDSEKWQNKFVDGIKCIDEKWNISDLYRYGGKNEKRVVFAKNKGEYCFLGIYRCVFIDVKNRVKRYEMISDKYPGR